MDEEGIALTGDGQQCIILIEILFTIGLANDDAFTLGGANVLPPCHFAIGEQFFGGWSDIQNPTPASVYRRGIGMKAQFMVSGKPYIHVGIIVSNIWFDAQNDRMFFLRNFMCMID